MKALVQRARARVQSLGEVGQRRALAVLTRTRLEVGAFYALSFIQAYKWSTAVKEILRRHTGYGWLAILAAAAASLYFAPDIEPH